MKTTAAMMILPLIAQGANYSAGKAVVDRVEIVRLTDASHNTQVSIAPSIGNTAYEMKVGGKNVLWFPFRGPAEWIASLTTCAIPFLAPWADRLDQDAFWANDRRYTLNPGLENLRRDQNGYPIHGLLYFSSAWRLVSAEADAHSARAVSRLEFWRHPEMMAQLPFAHSITMTHRLAEGVLEVETLIENHSSSPMPVGVGFHPFFRLHDSPRPQWSLHVAARQQVLLNQRMVPTGRLKKADYADPQPLSAVQLDDVLTDLDRGSDGRAVFWVKGKREMISVAFGPRYPVAVVFTPPEKEAVCLEPMAAITNAFNLFHRGLYKDLQSIPPGGRWKESFWIMPEGF
jgi:aldose 1-epimerase